MTIPLSSKSYPYLAIAQAYCIDYGKVLKYSEYLLARKDMLGSFGIMPYRDWRMYVFKLEVEKYSVGKRGFK